MHTVFDAFFVVVVSSFLADPCDSCIFMVPASVPCDHHCAGRETLNDMGETATSCNIKTTTYMCRNAEIHCMYPLVFALAHLSLVPHICINEAGPNWLRQWLVTCWAPSHHLNQCWDIVNWTLRKKLQWNFNQNTKLLIHENASKSIVCEKVAIWSGGRWVNHSWYDYIWPEVPWHMQLYSLARPLFFKYSDINIFSRFGLWAHKTFVKCIIDYIWHTIFCPAPIMIRCLHMLLWWHSCLAQLLSCILLITIDWWWDSHEPS